MNFIPCNSDCAYQRDGCCSLEHATTVSNSIGDGCAYYVTRKQKKNNESESDTTRTMFHFPHLRI